MEQSNEIKWIVNRIDRVFDEHINIIEHEITDSEAFREQEVGRFKGLEKSIVSLIVVLSSLVFGLNQIGVTGIDYVSWITVIFLIGGFVYLITTIFTAGNKKIFDDIHNSLINGTTQLYALKSNYDHQTMILKNTIDDFDNFADYLVKIVMPAIHIPVYYRYKKSLGVFRVLFLSFTAIKKIAASKKVLKEILDDAAQNHKDNQSSFESNSLIGKNFSFGSNLQAYLSYKK